MENTDKERWQQVKNLLASALEYPAFERQHFLDKACGNDLQLRAEIESLLRYEQTQDPMQELSKDHFKEPEQIGPYKILRTLGRGGMGTVYLAERADDQYRKQVAMKLIRQDMSSEFVVNRFRNERQILASLDHPNIARLVDGGTTENGLPYLVMDYIEGVPIHEYCDSHKLNTEKRLILFQQLCSAVQYAHQRLVIHRDIKPNNILVTKEGRPTLLDFGIAKLLTPELAAQTLDATGTAMRLMTPEYASPEQVRGELITTATDVYALGVILYELLTGRSPYRPASSAVLDIVRAVCEYEPEKPSTAIHRALEIHKGEASESITPETVSRTREGDPEKLHRKLRGDIDNIVLKALRKEPRERYVSVEQFSEDIRRHLEGLPVTARRPTLVYRARKFALRNRAIVVAAVLILILLIGGIIGINQQRLRAERRFNDVRRLAHAVVFDYHDAIADLPGSTPVRQRLVKDALQYLDSLAAEARDDQALQRELASAYVKIGDVQGNSKRDNLGDTTGALRSYRNALQLQQSLIAENSDSADLQREMAETHTRIGDILSDRGEIQPALESYQNALAILEKFPPDEHLAEIYFRIGDIKGNPFLPNLGDPTAALENHRKALGILKALPETAEVRADLVNSYRTLAGILLTVGKIDEAEQNARQAVTIAQSLSNAEPGSVRASKALGSARESLGRILMTREKWDEALIVFRDILASDKSISDADPKNVQVRRFVSTDYSMIGHILANQKQFTDALASHQQALSIDQELSALDPKNDSARLDVSIDNLSVADVLVQMNELTQAVRHQEEAVRIQEDLTRKDPNDFQAALNLSLARDRYAETLALKGEHQKALEQLRPGVPIGERALKEDPTNDRARRQLALRYFRIGNSSIQLANYREGCEAYQRSLPLLQELQKKGVLPSEHADKPALIATELQECRERRL